MRYALLLVLGARLVSAGEQDPQEVLSRVTVKVLAMARNIPNYTCVETVKREYFQPAASTLPVACKQLLELRRHPTLAMVLRPVKTDRLRLDVALTKGGEILSWAGASQFDEGFVDHVVSNGPIGTGVFGSLVAVLFAGEVKRFEFLGKTTVKGRELLEYSFQVPKAESHFKLRADNSWVYTTYGGTIRVDPETADLVSMTVETAELPPATGECMSSINLAFRLVEIGSAEFLLPKLAKQRFVSPIGEEVENTTEFANCREYKGESTVIFEEAPAPATGGRPRAAATPLSVPNGSYLSFELTTPIAGDTAAAGDLFHGKLIQPLRDPRQKVLAPKGTLLEGHIVRVESYPMPGEVLIVLKPEWVEIKGSRVPLRAVPDWRRTMVPSRAQDRKRMVFDLPQPGEEHAGIFRFPGEHAVVAKGFQSDWRIVARQ